MTPDNGTGDGRRSCFGRINRSGIAAKASDLTRLPGLEPGLEAPCGRYKEFASTSLTTARVRLPARWYYFQTMPYSWVRLYVSVD